MRGEWIEIIIPSLTQSQIRSLPMRGEWIEIISLFMYQIAFCVSPHAGRVD